jgi:hypothetical protein
MQSPGTIELFTYKTKIGRGNGTGLEIRSATIDLQAYEHPIERKEACPAG